MTKHDTEITSQSGSWVSYGIPAIPQELADRFIAPSNDPAIAREPFASGVNRALTFATDVNNDGIFIGNMWRPIPFVDSRNLPYEHPTRHEWDDARYDDSGLNFQHELLPTGWTSTQYKRFRSWEFGMFIRQYCHKYILPVTWKAFHGVYDPKLFFFGCNAGWLEPNPENYTLFSEYSSGSSHPITPQEIQQRYESRRQKAMAVAFNKLEYIEERRTITPPENYEVKAYANPTVRFTSSQPGFYWKYASYEKLKAIRPPNDPLFPRLDLCDEQYEWDRDAYDRPDLDFSAEPTLPGYTRIQFLRRRAWEKSCYDHRVAKLTGKRNKPREPVIPQQLIDKLNTNN